MANKPKRTPISTEAKALDHRVYPRGNQGTFIYAPDIAVYVSTDEYGIIDLSPFVTSFSLQRTVNAMSTFMCSFDNKFSRYDRAIRRMDRIVVFMKRVQWVQVFSGYISQSPWETVVPGDAQLMADCTLKRIVYTYWDPHSAEAQVLFPGKSTSIDAASPDGGSASTMFKLLTTIAAWPQDQIQIQKLPEKWLSQAVSVLRKTQDDDLNDPDFESVRSSLITLLGEKGDGWLGYPDDGSPTIGDLLGSAKDASKTLLDNGLGDPRGVEEKWRNLVGDRKGIKQYPPNYGTHLQYVSGLINEQTQLNFTGLLTKATAGHASKGIYLRPDAADSLAALDKEIDLTDKIIAGYISYEDQKRAIQRAMNANKNDPSVACKSVSCPAGISEHGWGTTIDFDSGQSPDEQTMNDKGWIQVPEGDGGVSNPDHWTFVGNYKKGFPSYVTAADKPKEQGRKHVTYTNTDGQFDWRGWEGRNTNGSASNVFKTTYYWPGQDTLSLSLVGKRAWINDVPLIESVSDMAAASLRDFQSAPNGDFVAFFPDRLGVYGKFPAMQVRDIEITDFKMSIQDRSLVTHYVSVADMTTPEPHTGSDMDVFINAGYVTVEQPEVMGLLLGMPEGEVPTGIGKAILDRFGIRPRRDDNYDIWNPGFNYMIALHRFQEAWASQWTAIVGFTFMPEIYPGMRIELVNYNIGVYVEQVVHSGSRTSGFGTTVTVSTPMTKKNGRWRILPMEFKPEEHNAGFAFADENSATQQTPEELIAEARFQRLLREGL